jgi:Ca2+-binding RTX toxin-like protein
MTVSTYRSLAEKVELVVDAFETGKAFTDSGVSIQTAAAISQILGTSIIGGLVTGGRLFTAPLVRLSAAIRGPAARAALDEKGWLGGFVVAEGLSQAIDQFNERGYGADIIEGVADFFVQARNWIARRDPLVLDLDGDGIETVAIDPDNPILFDLTGNGIKTGVGWIKSDDGFLVFDRNGNGEIDNGRELFGDATPLLGGGTAVDGIAALADLDANADGKIDAGDAVFAQLRVWQDVSQDGISQSEELLTLDSLGIVAIGLTRIPSAPTLDNGNQIADRATYERLDGSTGGVGTSGVADVNLVEDTFHREFTDHIPPNALTRTLPDTFGSGRVRDLREGATLSSSLAATLDGFGGGYRTRAELWASVDGIIAQWVATSDMQTGVQKAEDKNKRLIYLAPGQTISELGLLHSAGGGSGSAEVISPAEQQRRAERRAQQTYLTNLIGMLERFYGTTFVDIQDTQIKTGAGAVLGAHDPNAGDPFAGVSAELSPLVFVPLSSAQATLLQQSYDALRQSVYDGLVLQTRLLSYLDEILLNIDPSAIVINVNEILPTSFDFSAFEAALAARFASQPGEAVRDLLDLQRLKQTPLTANGWDGYGLLQGWLEEANAISNPSERAAVIAAIKAGLADSGYSDLRVGGDGTSVGEVVIGASAGATLGGAGGNDLVLGGEGADVLNGGIGNDILRGGGGNDTYVFNLGDEADIVVETQGATGIDTLQFGPGVVLGDLDIFIDSDKLVFAHANGRDRVSVANWFGSADDSAHQLDIVRFADGSTLDLGAIQLGTAEADTLAGTEGDDILAAGGGDDILFGAEGNDLLNGGTGADQMSGGAGDDIYVVDNAGDVVTELADEGIDTVFARTTTTLADHVENMQLVGTGNIGGTGNALGNVMTGNDGANALHGMDGNDTLIGGAGSDLLQGGAGLDAIQGGTGNDVLDGGTGADAMSGGTGDDRYVVDDASDLIAELAGEGTDTVETGLSYTLGANVENLSLTGMDAVDGTGNELANVLTGNGAANTLAGLAGNDTLNGGAGADTMLGGTGNDTYVVESAGDLVVESAGEGIDLVQSSITYTLTGNVENLTLTGTAAIDGTGNTLDNVIVGNLADNILTGLEGHDTLDGRAGADTMSGGLGDDTYVVDRLADVVLENAGEGSDTVQSEISYTLLDNFENLTLIGGGSINGTGNAADNVLVGNGGHNVLDGGAGADLMAGGSGNDTYILDNTGDAVVEQPGGGADTVLAPFDYTLGANLENLTLTGTALTGTGNALDNSIVGTSAHNTLTGLDGNDVLDGGEGADTLIGGRGNDTYVVDSLLDSVTELAGEGVDTVQSSLTWTLGASLENLTLTGSAAIDGTGNELSNVLTGNSADNVLTSFEGDDVLDGGAGADTLTGGTGSDTYVVDNTGDLVTEHPGEGTDLVRSSITYTLTAEVENLTLTGLAAINGTGNMLDNVLIGNAGANILSGLEGNDTLNGGEAGDTLAGGTGDDTYFVDNTADTIVENAGEGSDTVFASATYTLADNVENLTLTGTASIGGTGNALGNVIVGNSGNNALHGLAGNDTLTGNAGADTLDGGLDADTMAGGAGNDTYVVDNAGDLVTEHLNGGLDEVRSSISYALGGDVENLTLTGSGSITGTSNELGNVIFGNAGDNALFGLAGSDTLLANAGSDLLDGGLDADRMGGGMGDDTYVVDNAGDLVAELAGEGIDTVHSGVTYTLTANVENLTLTGGAAIDGTGNTLNNLLIGNTAGNRLDGAAGADTMLGGMGNDTYIVDDMGDVVTENADAGIDTVQSSISYTLTDSVENLALTGTADLNGTGNMLDNAISGTSGANALDGGAGVDMMQGGAGDDCRTRFGRARVTRCPTTSRTSSSPARGTSTAPAMRWPTRSPPTAGSTSSPAWAETTPTSSTTPPTRRSRMRARASTRCNPRRATPSRPTSRT